MVLSKKQLINKNTQILQILKNIMLCYTIRSFEIFISLLKLEINQNFYKN